MARTVLVTGTYLDPAAASRLAEAGFEAVYAHERTSSEDLASLARAHRIHGLIARQGRIDATVITASDELAAISRHGTGVDAVDVDTASALGIPVARARGANSRSVAEHALAFMLALVKKIPALDRSVRSGEWIKQGYVGLDLVDRRLGIVGYGSAGRMLSGVCRALGMDVSVYDPGLEGSGTTEDGALVSRSPHALAEWCDILSLHCPLNAQTHHLVDDAFLERMPMGSFLINTARGGIVDDGALLRALESGRLAGAGLDTFEDEPPPRDHPLMGRDDVLLSPHVAGAGRSGMRGMAMQSVENLIDLLSGRDCRQGVLVNPHVMAGRS